MVEQGRVAEVEGRAAAALTAAGSVDVEVEGEPAAPDKTEPEHIVAPRDPQQHQIKYHLVKINQFEAILHNQINLNQL